MNMWNLPDEVADAGAHTSLDVDLRHGQAQVREPLHERAIELVQLAPGFAVHRKRCAHVQSIAAMSQWMTPETHRTLPGSVEAAVCLRCISSVRLQSASWSAKA